MDFLFINQKVYIRRSDGRIHQANIVKLDGGCNDIVSVEWNEGPLTQGKDVPLRMIVALNPHIFKPPEKVDPVVPPPRPENRDEQQQVETAEIAEIAEIADAEPLVPREVSEKSEDDVLVKIERLRMNRERRRQGYIETLAERNSLREECKGDPNWEVILMIRAERCRLTSQPAENLMDVPVKHHQILVCVRKRPLNSRELVKFDPDVITVPSRELVVVHEPRKHVDLTKYLENHSFRFDYTFDEKCTNVQVYERAALPLVWHIFEGGMATCFAYGQTGSGKTHTMGGVFTGKQQNFREGIYGLAARDVFKLLGHSKYSHLRLCVSCSFFELYGTKVYDLLMRGKPELRVLEDKHQKVNVVGLTERPVDNIDGVLKALELGNSVRTCGQTSANTKSSRSHAVFQIVLRKGNLKQLHGKFSLIDLAGNERGADNSSSNRHTRVEGAEINKSLLALKECIRALGRQSRHLPFRGSKLTQVLRDSFIGGNKVKTCMIAMISPGLHSVEHTLNTLRYADRVKELTTKAQRKGPLRTVLGASRNIARRNSLPIIPSQVNQVNQSSSQVSPPNGVAQPVEMLTSWDEHSLK